MKLLRMSVLTAWVRMIVWLRMRVAVVTTAIKLITRTMHFGDDDDDDDNGHCDDDDDDDDGEGYTDNGGGDKYDNLCS